MNPTGIWWLDILVVPAIIVASIAVLWRPVKMTRRFVRKVDAFLSDWRGQDARPGFDRIPGIPERLRRVEHEVQTNHGQSLKDAVKRIELKQDQIMQRMGNNHGPS